ncbi:MAG: LTA synthase family protein [Prevotella sp.]
MKRRLLYLTGFYLSTVVIFLMAKVMFMYCYRADYPFSFADVYDVVAHGLGLDLSTSLYLLIIPFLLTVASMWLRIPHAVFKCFYAFIAVVLSLAFVADTSLYEFWHFKLDASCLQYLETPTEAMASVTTGYLLFRLVIFVLIAFAIYQVYARQTPSAYQGSWGEGLLYLLLIPLIVIGIRGGLSESTTNIGQVYFSQNQFLNHSAVNPVFSFLSSIGKSGNNIVSYDYYTEEECRELTDSLFDTRSIQTDTLLRVRRPNVVIILMESCGGQFTKLGGHPEITPRLNQLAEEGVYFTQCYANSWRTDKGTVSVLSGYPALPITSVMKLPEKSRKLPAIASSLSQEGYATGFFYGGDINFTNMRSYVLGTGYGQLRWKADYTADEQRSAQWGVRDDIMFQSLFDDIQAEQHHHWMKTMLTLSSHEPWDVPTHQLEDPVYNAFNYLDGCVGQFVDRLKQTPLWEDLLVIILPDHGYRYQGVDETTPIYNHIPMIWVGGAIKEPRHVDAYCNQSDLAATLLGQMGIDHSAYTFSRDVLGSNYSRPFAWHTYNNGVSLFDPTGFMAYDLDVEQTIASAGPDKNRQLRLAQALLQVISHDLIAK